VAKRRAERYIKSSRGRAQIEKGLREFFTSYFFPALEERLEELEPKGWVVNLTSIDVDPSPLYAAQHIPGQIEIVVLVVDAPNTIARIGFQIQSSQTTIDAYLTLGGRVDVYLMSEDDAHNIVSILHIDRAEILFHVGGESIVASYASASVLTYLGGYQYIQEQGRFVGNIDQDAVDAISNMIVRVVSFWDRSIVLKRWANMFFISFSSMLFLEYEHSPGKVRYRGDIYLARLLKLERQPDVLDKEGIRVEIVEADGNCLAFRFIPSTPFVGVMMFSLFSTGEGKWMRREEGETEKVVNFSFTPILFLQIKPNNLHVSCTVEVRVSHSKLARKVNEVLYNASVHHLEDIVLPDWNRGEVYGKMKVLLDRTIFHIGVD